MTKKTEEENYQKFLKGVFWIKGWNTRKKEILQAVPYENRLEMKQFLDELGEKIGREWAKESRTRKINSKMLKKWGSELQEAVALGPARLVEQLKTIECEANEIISKKS